MGSMKAVTQVSSMKIKKIKTTAEFEYFPPEFVLIVRKELKGKLETRELFKFSIYVVNVFVFV